MAWAQVDLGGLSVTPEQLRQLQIRLPKTQKDRFFFHWTNKATGMRWVKQGNINSGEVNFYNIATGDRQVHGPGIYLAESPTSSKGFGEIPVTFKVDKGTPLYDEKIITEILGQPITKTQASKLGEHIPLLRQATDDWYVINHAQHTKEIGYGRKLSPEAKVYVRRSDQWTQFNFKADFKELVDQGHADAKYLKNILDASEYMDGISFARAMKVSPSAPWNEFEPHNFENYQRALGEFSDKFEKYTSGSMGTPEQILLDVHNTFTNDKHVTNIKDSFRIEGIRGGGDEAHKSFLATAEQLKVLKENPYLEVVSEAQGKNHLVYYFYPDALHYKKLKDRISPALYAKLEAQNAADLMNNHALRNSLNKELISELVTDFLARLRSGKASFKDLISIHPFENMNGRTVRMFQEIFANGSNHFILGDIDLLLPLEQQKLYWQRSAEAHNKLQVDLIDEFLMARTENRMPDYLKTDALKDYVNNAFPTKMNIDLNNPQTLEDIRLRRWVPIIENGRNEGLKDIAKLFNNPATKSQAVNEITNIARPHNIQLFDKDQLKTVLKLSENVLSDKTLTVTEKVPTLKTYETILGRLDPEDAKNAKPVSKIKSDLLENVKTKLRDSKAITDFDQISPLTTYMKQIEPDPILHYNHLLSTLSPNNSTDARTLIHKELYDAQRTLEYSDTFEKMGPADQKRLLMSIKAHVEKNISLKEKKWGENSLEAYKTFYKNAKPEAITAMPTFDKLRSWTRRAGAGDCTLAQLLIKLGP